jgi:hypothetical protein
MTVSLVLLAILLFIGFLFLNGWIFQRAARILGVQVSLGYATLVAVAGAIAQAVAQVIVAFLVVGTVDSYESIGRGDILMTQGSSFVLGTAAWTALTSVMLDVDLLKAFAIGLIFSLLQIVAVLFAFVTCGNLVLITLMTVGAGS